MACPIFFGDDAAVQEAEVKAKKEAEAKAKKKSKAKAKEEAEAKAAAEAKAKEVQEAKAKAKAAPEAEMEVATEPRDDQSEADLEWGGLKWEFGPEMDAAKAQADEEAEAKAKEEAKAKAEVEAKLKEEEEVKANTEGPGEKQQAPRRRRMLEKGFPFGTPLHDHVPLALFWMKVVALERLGQDIEALPDAQFKMLRPTLVDLRCDLTAEEVTLDLEDYSIDEQRLLVARVRALKAAVAPKVTVKALKATAVQKKTQKKKKYWYVDNRPNYRYRHTPCRPYRRAQIQFQGNGQV